MERKELHAIVSGMVQMVMFRDFVRRRARQSALTGFVRNLNDGTVEVVAQGNTDRLEDFLENLKPGSFLSRVSSVKTEWRNPTRSFDAFDIVV